MIERIKQKLKIDRAIGACLTFILLACIGVSAFKGADYDNIVSYTANLKTEHLALYWKDDKGKILGSLGNLKDYVNSKRQRLVFAMNGGMYMENQGPLGLYIEHYKTYRGVNRDTGYGNFYLKPNGIFYITKDNKPVICRTEDFKPRKDIPFATQSGPLLLINGQIHPQLKEGSRNLNIRNGVGILPDNRVLFAISKEGINFYDFASFFRNKGCKYALYLDGAVSRAYIPSRGFVQTDGNFGVMIGVSQ